MQRPLVLSILCLCSIGHCVCTAYCVCAFRSHCVSVQHTPLSKSELWNAEAGILSMRSRKHTHTSTKRRKLQEEALALYLKAAAEVWLPCYCTWCPLCLSVSASKAARRLNASLHPHTHTLIGTLHYTCCYDEINGIQDLKIWSHADSLILSLSRQRFLILIL